MGNRKLLDQYHESPRDAALVYWLLASWGNGTAEQNWRDAMRDMQQHVAGPRRYLLDWAPHLELARQLGILGESIFFPYGIIEGEPTFPLTNLNFAMIRRALDYTANYKGLEGTMANSQTFLMQAPQHLLLHAFRLERAKRYRNRSRGSGIVGETAFSGERRFTCGRLGAIGGARVAAGVGNGGAISSMAEVRAPRARGDIGRLCLSPAHARCLLTW